MDGTVALWCTETQQISCTRATWTAGSDPARNFGVGPVAHERDPAVQNVCVGG